MTDPCQFLPWDTAFFERRIARVMGHQLNPQRVDEIQQWCVSQDIACLYFLADSESAETIRLAEDNGFRLMDMRLTLEHKAIQQLSSPAMPGNMVIRESCADDLPALVVIARSAYQQSRFYFDPCFSDNQRAALYETWIRRSCEEDYAAAVIVAEMDSEPVGYISCHLSVDKILGQIGLVGVAPHTQGQGIGGILLQHTLHWFAQQGVEAVSVVTQGRNIPAQRLYQRSGFITQSLQLWYHKWFTDCQ